jgi:beta-galactosidase
MSYYDHLPAIRHYAAQRYALTLVGFVTLSFLSAPVTSAEPPVLRERVCLNAEWRFAKGDPAQAEGKLSYEIVRPWLLASAWEFPKGAGAVARPDGNPGADVAYTQPEYDDSSWRQLNLPHDWGIEGPFKQEYPSDSGRLPSWGVGWYRKHFTLPAGDAGKQFYLDVDGAMSYAAVWCNGHLVGGWPYGYSSWRLDLTPYVKPGASNVLAIRLDNLPESSRWYPGGGLYRNVWLVKTAPVHVSHWGTYLTTPVITKEAAQIRLKVNLDNRSVSAAQVGLATEIYPLNAEGEKARRAVVSSKLSSLAIVAGGASAADFNLTVPAPRLWSVQQPNRYVAVVTIEQDGKAVDTYETEFGIRSIQFSATDGFLLNGERVALHGVCDHHDLGALGAALNVRALERQLQILREMGCNAIRTSHNPPAPELLDLCDRMGFVVVDEAFDAWLKPKKHSDYHLLFADWHEQDLRALMRRDRNHPCVILWSVGNEVPEQITPEGPRIAGELAAIAHSEDPSRLVAAACDKDAVGFNGFQKPLDVIGFNYRGQHYGEFHQANPSQPVFATETASCTSSRGEYFFPVSTNKAEGLGDFQVSDYDLYAPFWAWSPDTEFEWLDRFPFVAGEFVWTGFDYLGEPCPYTSDLSDMPNGTDPALKARLARELKETGKIQVPSRSAYFGIIDLAGFKKDRFYIYQARWRPQMRMAHILPHWTWPERVGQVTPVHVYTSGDAAELFLNGHSLGLKKRGPYDYRLRWDDVVYQPGELKVIAYKQGVRWATDVMKTAGPAAKLALEPDRAKLRADGRDLSFVTVRITDTGGQLAPRAKDRIKFELSGPAEIVATDNGDATSFESFQAKEHSAFNGLCLVVVRSTGEAGLIVLEASAPGLKGAEVKLQAK